MRVLITLVLLLLALPASAQQQADAMFLFPLAPGERPGANGAVWRTAIAIANDGGGTLNLLGDVDPPLACGPITCSHLVFPGMTFTGLAFAVPPRRAADGLLFRVRPAFAREVSFSIHLSSRSDDPGIRVPVVAEDELFTGPANLMMVQLSNERQRTVLRLYDPDAVPGAALRVRAFTLGGSLIADRVVPLVIELEEGPHRVFPGYASVPIDTAFFSIRDINPATVLRLRVEPMAGGQRFWAMASMTDNATNHVVLVSPEP